MFDILGFQDQFHRLTIFPHELWAGFFLIHSNFDDGPEFVKHHTPLKNGEKEPEHARTTLQLARNFGHNININDCQDHP